MPVEPVDVLVIGCGPAGAAVTKRLTDLGANVVCLEQGDWVDKASFPSERSDWEIGFRRGPFSFSANVPKLPEDYPVASHLMGTAHMGDDPKSSVVNVWNQAHDVKNLFDVDGNSFATSGSVNPNCAIGALALRAADGIWQGRREWS